MTVKAMFLVLLSGILVNNYALEQFLGVTPFLGNSRKGAKTVGLGAVVTLMMLLATAATWPLQNYVLAPKGLEHLQVLAFVAVIVVLAYVLDAVARKVCKCGLRAYWPVLMLNSAVLGLCINNVSAGLGYAEALLSALAVGLGFMLGMLVMEAVNSRIEMHHVPKAFRGLPITLLAASFVCLALYAF